MGKNALDILAALMEDDRVKKVIHNAKVDLSFIRASQRRRLRFKNIFDPMLASQICWAGFCNLVPSKSPKHPWKKIIPDHGLEALAERHLGVIPDKSCQTFDWDAKDLTPKQINYAINKVMMLLPLHAILQELLVKNGLEKVADLEFRTISSVVEIELSGIYLDADAARALILEKQLQLARAVMDLQAEAKMNGFSPLPREGKKHGLYFDPDSPDDIKRYLSSQGFSIISTRAEILKELANGGSIFVDRLLSYRRISHQLSFMEDWLKQIRPTDGRIHPKYFQLQSATGRLSSRKPNAQQIP